MKRLEQGAQESEQADWKMPTGEAVDESGIENGSKNEHERWLRISALEGEQGYFKINGDVKDEKILQRFAGLEADLSREDMVIHGRGRAGLEGLRLGQLEFMSKGLTTGDMFGSTRQEVIEKMTSNRDQYSAIPERANASYLDGIFANATSEERQIPVDVDFPSTGERAMKSFEGYERGAMEDGRIDLAYEAFRRKTRLREIRRSSGPVEKSDFNDLENDDPMAADDEVERLAKNISLHELNEEIAELERMVAQIEAGQGEKLRKSKEALPRIQGAIEVREKAIKIASRHAV